MKRFMDVVLAVSFACLLAACGGGNKDEISFHDLITNDTTSITETPLEGVDFEIKDNENCVTIIIDQSYKSEDIYGGPAPLVPQCSDAPESKIWLCEVGKGVRLVQVTDNWCIILNYENKIFREFRNGCIHAVSKIGCNRISSRWR